MTEEKTDNSAETITLNFKPDEPTVNGHIYSKEVIKTAFNQALNNRPIPIVEHVAESVIFDVSKTIGFANKYNIDHNNNIKLDCEFTKIPKDIDKRIFSTAGYGDIDENKNITDFTLSHVFMVPPEKPDETR